MFGIGGMIGGGIFALSGEVALKAGLGAFLVFTIAGLIALSSGLVYAEFSTKIVGSGGGYTYVSTIFPDFFGFLTGWWFFLAYTLAGAFYAEVFGKYMEALTNTPFLLWSILLAVFFALINFIGIRESSIAETALTLFKLLIIAIFIVGGFLTLNISTVIQRAEIRMYGSLVMLATVFISFEGFDIISTLSSEMINPTKAAPKAVVSSILIVTGLYILTVLMVLATIIQYGLPANIMPEEIILYAAKNAIGKTGLILLGTGAIVSTISAYNATLCAASRVGLAMGENKALPRIFKLLHPKTRTPHASIFLSTFIIISLLVISNMFLPFEEISIIFGQLASLFFAFSFSMVDFSLIIYRNLSHNDSNSFKTPLYPLTPLFGFIGALLIGGILAIHNLEIFLTFLFLTIVGTVVYLFLLRKAKSPEEALRIVLNDIIRAKEALSIREFLESLHEKKK